MPGNSNHLLQNVIIYDGSGAPPVRGSVLVVEGKVALLGEVPASVAPQDVERVDLHGLAVSPGFINIHSHSDIQVLTHPEAKALVMQGITTETIGNCGGSSVDTSKWDESAWKQILSRTLLKHRWDGVRGYLAAVDEVGPAVNVAAMFGHGDIRRRIVGDNGRPLTEGEKQRAERMASSYMAEGAFGVTSGLEYIPGRFADVEELAAVSRPVAAAGGIHASHIRNEGPELLESIQECIAVSRLSGVRFEVSHIKACGPENWGKVKEALAMLDAESQRSRVTRWRHGNTRGTATRGDSIHRAATSSDTTHDAASSSDAIHGAATSSDTTQGAEMTADFYPYLASSTELAIVLPDWVLEKGKKAALVTLKDPGIRRRAELESHQRTELQGGWDKVVITGVSRARNKWMEGKNVAEIASRTGKEPPVAALDILMDEAMQVRIARFAIGEDDLITIIKHPQTCVVTDGNNAVPEEGKPHPRSTGTFPRVLGHYAREKGVISMEEAVRKMTSLPAQRLGIPDRGLVAPGFWADLVVFDRDTVVDRATYDSPWQYPAGIFAVFVNGEPVVWQGEHTGVRPGVALRHEVG